MKTIFTTLFVVLCSVAAFSQAPESLNYQAVIRNADGQILANQEVTVDFTIYQGSVVGPVVYAETNTLFTDIYGHVDLRIGNGVVTQGNFSTIDWGADLFLLETTINGQNAGTEGIGSVPYSLYSNRAGTAADDFDKSPDNEIQQLTIAGDQLSLTNGGGTVTIPQTPSKWDMVGNDLVNNNTGNVGIGSALPLSKLHVEGSFRVDGPNNFFAVPNFSVGNGAVLAGAFEGKDAAPQIRFNNTASSQFIDIGTNGNEDFILEASDDIKMIVQQNGNVGVGTNRPDNTFQVQTRQAVGTPMASDDSGGAAGTAFGPDTWQSITASQSGYIVSVDAVYAGSNDPTAGGTLSIYEGEGVNGNLLHRQQYGEITGFVGYKSFELTSPVYIAESTVYTVHLNSFLWTFSANPYDGGRCNWSDNADYAFRINIVESIEDNTTLSVGNGKVGIGTNTPSEKLEVIGNICHTGSIGACSDERYKTDFKALANPLEKIQQLNGLYYNWKQDEFPEKQFTDERQIGVIAQEVEKFFPEIVMTNDEGYKSVDYSKLTPILLEAIKEQQKLIFQMDAQINSLENNLMSRMAALENKMTGNNSASVNADE